MNENEKVELAKKRAEREAFWAEYKRRLAIRDDRNREMQRLLGFHSHVLAGTMIVDQYLPPPHYGPSIAVSGNRPQMRQPNRRTVRRQAPQTKG
jgi:hypothetical protein